jgi:hypothetical protein
MRTSTEAGAMARITNLGLRLLRKTCYWCRKILLRLNHELYLLESKLTSAIISGHAAMPAYPGAKCKSFEEIYYSGLPCVMPVMPSLPRLGRTGMVTVFVPTLNDRSFFGGIATVLLFAGYWSRRLNLGLRIVQTVVDGHSESLQEFFADNGLSIRAGEVEIVGLGCRRHNLYGYLDIHPDDRFVVSAWWDAHIVSSLPIRHKFVYLIQDYEPLFYPNGDRQCLARESYRLENFVAVCNTGLMYDFVRSGQIIGAEVPCTFFEPALRRPATEVRQGGDAGRRKKVILLYARPSVERNLYYLGLKVIGELVARGILAAGEVEVFLAGEDEIGDIDFGDEVSGRCLGKMPLKDYYEFLRTVDLGLSFMMSPHPSYPPLEMALAGAAVVTTAYSNKTDLRRYSENIFVARPELDAIVEKVLPALELSFEARQRNAARTLLPRTWRDSFEAAFEYLDCQQSAAESSEAGAIPA